MVERRITRERPIDELDRIATELGTNPVSYCCSAGSLV